MRLCLLLIVAGLGCLAHSQLGPAERRGLIETLYLGNLTEDDLKFTRRTHSDGFALPLCNLAVDDPIGAADQLIALHERGRGSLTSILQAACTVGLGDPQAPKISVPKPATVPHQVPPALQRPVGILVTAISDANAAVRSALEKLSPDERRDVIESLPRWANPLPTVKFDFVRRPQVGQEELLKLISRVDLVKLRAAACVLATLVEQEIPEIRAAKADIASPVEFSVGGVRVELTGRGNDVHTARNTNLCIDLGGDNAYTGRYGAGVGYTAVLIDLGRHSRFEGPDVNFGAGLLGIGLAYISGGDDCTFQGGSLSFGAGFAGVGGFSKAGGNDQYRAAVLSEGASAFGVGVLLDTAGDDHYLARSGAQGFGRTGGFGWLVDEAGDDSYRAVSGQGCGVGAATADGFISGGIGLLTDFSGNDIYKGGVQCQAAASAGGLGSLYDATGDDVYVATDEAQASARLAGGAYLFDLAGNDSYTLHGGLGHATASDRGVAFLLDRAGNDIYASMDARPGTGLTGGLGLFMDAAGDDRYLGQVGVAVPSHDSSSLGIFADLAGSDRYSDGFTNEHAAIEIGDKIAYDAPTPQDDLVVATTTDHKFPAPGSISRPTDAELEKLYQLAVQPGPNTSGIDGLVGIGTPAYEWLLAHKLTAIEPRRDRAFYAFLQTLGTAARGALANKIDDPNDQVALAALEISLHYAVPEAASHLLGAFARPPLQKQAALLTGKLGQKQLASQLVLLLSSSDHLTVLDALVGLDDLVVPDGVGAAQSYIDTTDLPIRDAALSYISKFPDRAIAIARSQLASTDERIQRVGIELLGRTATPEALDLIGPYLSRGSMGLKIQALFALNGRCPSAATSAFLALREDPNSLIKAVASWVDPRR